MSLIGSVANEDDDDELEIVSETFSGSKTSSSNAR